MIKAQLEDAVPAFSDMRFLPLYLNASCRQPRIWLNCAASIVAFLIVPALTVQPAAAETTAAPVTITEDGASYLLANGIVSARVEKRSGRVSSLRYQGLELLAGGGGYWSQVGRTSALGSKYVSSVSIAPQSNGGERAEVSCKFSYDGQPGCLPVDVEMRYALGKGEHGIYVYSIWQHPVGYPAFSLGEARYALKLNPGVFDYLTVDANRRRVMPSGQDWDHGTPLNLKEVRRMTTGSYAGQVEHKYDYSAVLSETPAYGWSSTKQNVGLWMVNPSMEYIGGGSTKVELTGHLDVNPGGLPTLLNMWVGSHYGGCSLAVGKDESWAKIVGPFLIYCNTASDPEGMWKDALARATEEAKAWPYAWVASPAYSSKAERATVRGRIVIRDPLTPEGAMSGNVRVGLSAPDYQTGSRWPARPVDWQRDAKFYQHWSRAEAEGLFTLENVRPGTYVLHAFADGVLGEYLKTNITVAPGQQLDLGALTWVPERRGRQLWEIGIPNRSAEEFRHGDHYWQWGLYNQYQREFPDGVNFTVGKSDWRKDWNYAQPPQVAPNGAASDSVWRVSFDLKEVPRGPVTLRLAFCGSRGGRVSVEVNDSAVGDSGELPDTAVMHRDGIRGYWFERKVTFDPARLKAGTNVIQLRNHASVWHQGVLYDYLRLEAADQSVASTSPGT